MLRTGFPVLIYRKKIHSLMRKKYALGDNEMYHYIKNMSFSVDKTPCDNIARTNTRGIKYTIFNLLVPLQGSHLAFGLVVSRRGTNKLNIVYFIPRVLVLAILFQCEYTS